MNDDHRLEATMEVVLDAHPDGILVLGRTGVVQYANPAAQELFDTPLGSIVGRQFSARIPSEDAVDLRTRSGRILELRAVPAAWNDTTATLVCVRDVTDQRALEARRDSQRPQQAGEVLLHDLRTAIGSAQVAVDSLEERVRATRLELVEDASDLLFEHADELEPLLTGHPALQGFPTLLASISEAMRRDRQRLVQETDRLRRCLSEVRSLVEQAQASPVATHHHDLATIVERVLAVEDAALERGGVEVEVAVSTAGEVLFDQRILLPVVLNLVANARQAVEGVQRRQAAIHISARRRWPGRVRIVVADNGRGIAEEHLPRLFDHGFTTRRNGRGIGLYACAAAARELGGRLSAHSDGPGHGATFILDLPVPDLPGQKTPPPAPERSAGASMSAT